MGKHTILAPSFTRQDDRGIFTEVINSGHWESLITGQMQEGAVLGNHYHQETTVFFFLTSGRVRIKTVHIQTGAQDEFQLEAEQGVMLIPYESHAIHFEALSTFMMLKSLHYDPAQPDTYPYRVED